MKFSGLKESYDAWCVGNLERIENKQRIRLSAHAHSVLTTDFCIFHPEEAAAMNEGELPSGFINNIFSCYKNEAHASIAHAVENHRLQLQTIFDPTKEKAVIDRLTDQYAQQLRLEQQGLSAEKAYSLVIRINSENLQYLLTEGQTEGPEYNDKIGLYIRAVLEEYCEKPYILREQYYYRLQLDEILLAITQKRMLKLRLHSRNKQGLPNFLYIKPLQVIPDAERLYNYLAGMTASQPDGPWQMGSVRLTSIEHCKRLEHPAFISDQVHKEIEKAIQEKGVSFLADELGVQKIVVHLTEVGTKMFRNILHLRPQPVTKIDPYTYVFSCSIKQADNYFFKFGHHATILEPQELAESFAQRYALASANYAQTTEP